MRRKPLLPILILFVSPLILISESPGSVDLTICDIGGVTGTVILQKKIEKIPNKKLETLASIGLAVAAKVGVDQCDKARSQKPSPASLPADLTPPFGKMTRTCGLLNCAVSSWEVKDPESGVLRVLIESFDLAGNPTFVSIPPLSLAACAPGDGARETIVWAINGAGLARQFLFPPVAEKMTTLRTFCVPGLYYKK